MSELLTNPDRFDRQPVTISGIMTKIGESVSRRGTRSYTFEFSDGKQTILVRSFERTPCRSGTATVEGTFEKAKQGGHFSNVVTARSVTCLSVQRC